MVLLGIRLMLRPSELMALRAEDVTSASGGRSGPEHWSVRIRSRKADQDGTFGRLPLVFERSGGELCPCAALERFIRVRGSAAGLLFCRRDGRALPGQFVTQLVRQIAVRADLPGRFGGHCLRIAGASWAAASGASIAQIQAVGGWASAAVLRYLHATSAAAAGLSARMFA